MHVSLNRVRGIMQVSYVAFPITGKKDGGSVGEQVFSRWGRACKYVPVL